MMIIGLILHALLFALLLGITDLYWVWALLISGAVVWIGVAIFDVDLFGW